MRRPRSATPHLPAALATVSLVTRRLVLRAPRLSDVTPIVELMADPTISRMIATIPYPYGPADARGWVVRSRRERRARRGFAFVLVRRRDRAVLGATGIHRLDPTQVSGEFGYWLGRPYRGQGYVTEAGRAVVGFGFARLGLHRIVAYTRVDNRASGAVLRRLGFRREGTLRDVVRARGGWESRHVYGRLAHDRRWGSPGRTR